MNHGAFFIIILIIGLSLIKAIDDKSNKSSFFDEVRKKIKNKFQIVLSEALNQSQNHSFSDIRPLSEQCFQALNTSYIIGPNDEYYLNAILSYSSSNKNELNSFTQCMKNPSNKNIKNLTYLIVSFSHSFDLEDHNDTNHFIHNGTIDTSHNYNHSKIAFNNSLWETKWKVLGLCVPSINCTEDEYATIIYYFSSYLDNFLEIHNRTEITTFKLKSTDFQFEWIDLLKLLPFFLIALQILLSLFNIFPYFLFKSCFKKTGNSIENESSESLINNCKYDKSKYTKFTKIFSLSNNTEEFFRYDLLDMKDDAGMTYLKGIIGINMLFLILGFVFFNLNISAATKYNERSFIHSMRSFTFSIYFYGMRYAPKILLSCSAFSMGYKILCFFEECFLKEQEDKIGQMRRDRHSDSEEIELNSYANHDNSNNTNDDDDEKRVYDGIYFSSLWKFWKYQLHKYILVILITIFVKFSLYKLVLLFNDNGPMWEYLKNKVIDSPMKFDWMVILSFVFGLHSFYVQEDAQEYFLNYQWMVYNEMLFFFISSFFIYIGYRYKIRVDIFFVSSMCIIVIMKLIVYYVSSEYYSSIFYYFFKYWNIISIPFFNYFYHCIGLLFGAANYVIQKDLTYEQAITDGKEFLVRIVLSLNKLKKKSHIYNYVMGSIITIIVVSFSCLQAIILQVSDTETLLENHLHSFLTNQVRNCFLLFDTYIIVFLFHFGVFLFYLMGNNAIINFFALNGWSILSKMYFSFILVVNPVIIYFLYQSETQINFDLSNTILYSLICIALVLVISGLIYVAFELPYKKIVKLLVKTFSEDENDNDGMKQTFDDYFKEQSNNGKKD